MANFNAIGIKKLITTHYIDNGVTLFDDIKPEHPYSLTIAKAPKDLLTLQRAEMVTHIIAENGGKNYLKGGGDFRSAECVELLKETDIVVTNPPFSLFREYVLQLVEYDKKFLIIGDQNAITYKEIFNLIKDNKLWFGYDNGGTKWFQVPMTYDDIPTKTRIKLENGKKYFSKGSIMWYTNLETTKRHEDLILYKKYKSEEYPKYDNYDAINVDKTVDIPMDYDGFMGVPITFLDKYNPEQFEILGIMNSGEKENNSFCWNKESKLTHGRPVIKGKEIYFRIIIRNRYPTKKENGENK